MHAAGPARLPAVAACAGHKRPRWMKPTRLGKLGLNSRPGPSSSATQSPRCLSGSAGASTVGRPSRSAASAASVPRSSSTASVRPSSTRSTSVGHGRARPAGGSRNARAFACRSATRPESLRPVDRSMRSSTSARSTRCRTGRERWRRSAASSSPAAASSSRTWRVRFSGGRCGSPSRAGLPRGPAHFHRAPPSPSCRGTTVPSARVLPIAGASTP